MVFGAWRRIKELEAEVSELRRALAERDRRIAERDRRIAELEKQARDLAAAIEEAQRSSKRQAAPFRRKKRKKPEERKKPGRKPGHPGSRMEPPEATQERVAEKPKSCSRCGGHHFGELQRHENVEVELPKVKPIVTRNVFWSAKCLTCGTTVTAKHPDQISTATGAAGVHLGARARAFAAELKYRYGIPFNKCSRIFREQFGLPVTPGGLYLANAQLGERSRATVAAIIEKLRQEAVVYADETGWWTLVRAWLWVISSERYTVYEVDRTRCAEVVRKVLGDEFAGLLMRDGWGSYDTRLLCRMLLCLVHLERNLEELEQKLIGPAKEEVGWLLGWISCVFFLRQEAKAGKISKRRYRKEAEDLVGFFDWWVERDDIPEELAKLRERLARARDQIAPYVEDPALPATNNHAERQTRFGVVIRKISGGNRSEQGARVFGWLTTVITSAQQQGRDVCDVLTQILRAPPGRPVPFWDS